MPHGRTALGQLTFAATATVFASSAMAQTTAAATGAATPVYVFGIPIDFILLALTLIGVATFRHKTLQVALAGLGWNSDTAHKKRVGLPSTQVTMGIG